MSDTEQSQPSDATLGLADLALMANIIQTTTQRGAIKAEEMEVVGALYKKLAEFVNSNAPKQNTNDSQNVQGEERIGEDQEESKTEDQ